MEPPMKLTPESSNVEAIGYDETLEEVWVRFDGGRTYAYENVPPTVWSDFESAASKGTFVNQVLKPSYLCHPA